MAERGRKCASCAADAARYRCTRCAAALYCGASCQRSHWLAGHHARCAPIGVDLTKLAPTAQLRPPKGAPGSEIVLQRRLGGGTSGTVWLASRGEGQQQQRLVAKLADLSVERVRRDFVKEVYAMRLLARISKTADVCGKNVRCAIESFVVTRADGQIGVLLSQAPPIEAETLLAFARGTLRNIRDGGNGRFADFAVYVDLLGSIARDLVGDVAALHGQRMTHRDLKPENVLVEFNLRRYQAVLIDFGSARPLPGADDAAVFAADAASPLGANLDGIVTSLSADERKALRAKPPQLPAWVTEVEGVRGVTPLYFDPRIAVVPGTDRLRLADVNLNVGGTLLQVDEFAIGASLYVVERGAEAVGEQLRAAAVAAAAADGVANPTPEAISDYIRRVGEWKWAPPNDPALVLNGVIQELIARTAEQRARKPLLAFVDDITRAVKNAPAVRTPPPPPPRQR